MADQSPNNNLKGGMAALFVAGSYSKPPQPLWASRLAQTASITLMTNFFSFTSSQLILDSIAFLCLPFLFFLSSLPPFLFSFFCLFSVVSSTDITAFLRTCDHSLTPLTTRDITLRVVCILYIDHWTVFCVRPQKNPCRTCCESAERCQQTSQIQLFAQRRLVAP